jgi:WD40 repeat protein
LAGHRRKVRAVAVADLGGRPIVVSGSNDNTLRVWDRDSGGLLFEPFVGHDGNVTAVAVGEVHGRPIAVSAGEDGTVRVWDLDAGAPLGRPFEGHHNWVNAVAVGQLGGRPIAVSGGCDKAVRVWDLDAGRQVGMPLRGHDDWVNAVAVGELGGRPIAVSGGSDQVVRVWDLEKAEPWGEPLVGHDDWVSAVAIGGIGDRTIAASASLDKSVRTWDLSVGGPLGWPLWQDSGVNAVGLGKIAVGPLPGAGDTIRDTEEPTAWTPATNFRREHETTPEPGSAGVSRSPRPAPGRKTSVRLSVQPSTVTVGEEITCRVDIDQIDAKVRGGHVELGYSESHYEIDAYTDDREYANRAPNKRTEWLFVSTVQLFEAGLEPGPQFVRLAIPEGAPPTAKDAVEWRVEAIIDRRRGLDALAEAPLVVRAAPSP